MLVLEQRNNRQERLYGTFSCCLSCRYYAVHNGRESGVYSDWSSAQAQVDGYSGNSHQSFKSHEAASSYVNSGPSEYQQQYGQVNLNADGYSGGNSSYSSSYYSGGKSGR